jgi:endo-1,4-beta-xylanase
MRFQYGLLVAIPLAAAQLNQLAKKAGKLYFGTATDNGELSNTTYRKILDNTNEFGQLTPSNGMKVRLRFDCIFSCTLQRAMAG